MVATRFCLVQYKKLARTSGGIFRQLFQGLYADTLMSFEEFFQMFSEFGEAYAKVKVDTARESAMDRNTRDTRDVIFLNNIRMISVSYIGASKTALLQ